MPNPFAHLETKLTVDEKEFSYFSLPKLGDARVKDLPYSIRILLESAVRNADDFVITRDDVEKILSWHETCTKSTEIPFRPARVILQDFTGVPCVVDLAAMRDAVVRLGGDASKINPLVPVDLVIDHSVQVDYTRSADAVEKNLDKEMERNKERFTFLKWGAKAFENLRIVPPGSGIVHQVNLEYLARVVMENEQKMLYPDSVVGTDSHTTMINGLGVVGWGVGGIEAEAVMLGQHISMVLPQVVAVELTGALPASATATDLVLALTAILRKKGVVEKFVEFFGPGVATLPLADRATLANMAPEYGATIGFFPVDEETLKYLSVTGRDASQIDLVRQYYKEQGMFADFNDASTTPKYTDIVKLDLSTIEGTLAGPKRPHDPVALKDMKSDFTKCLTNVEGFKGYGLKETSNSATVTFEGKEYKLSHGSVVIAAITSCTNTSNPSVLIAAGMVAKKAVELGLTTKPYIKTSLAPGSHVATEYLAAAGLQEHLDTLGFNTVGYGCTTCIGNSGDIPAQVEAAINDNGLVAAAVLSGNRNFEGRVHPSTRANYLASPPLVVAYALAGTVDIDFETEPIGTSKDGKAVFLRDLWPTRQQINAIEAKVVTPHMFKEVYKNITDGTAAWRALEAGTDKIYGWGPSTYINHPPFFATMQVQPDAIKPIENASCLLNLGDSITTDHISPAGNIARNSPAAKFLQEQGVAVSDFNSYGSRRGNDLIMARGTFANTRLVNKMVNKAGPKTKYVPTGEEMFVFDAAQKYKEQGVPLVILGGQLYGSGSSRDWAAKGPYLQGVRAVIAQSFERIHRSNLVGMGVLPLEFLSGQSADTLGLTGDEQFTIVFPENLGVSDLITVKVTNGKIDQFQAQSRIDTAIEVDYYKHGGILQYVLRQLL